MNLSKFFIDRPIFAGVLSTLIFLGGLIALFAMPISEYPDVVPPSVVVRATYPGANPKVIAETVATPIEEQINGVENMLYMSSQATTDGAMTLTVTFKLGTDPDKATQLVADVLRKSRPRFCWHGNEDVGLSGNLPQTVAGPAAAAGARAQAPSPVSPISTVRPLTPDIPI